MNYLTENEQRAIYADQVEREAAPRAAWLAEADKGRREADAICKAAMLASMSRAPSA